ncbi:hypothetical protein AB0O01_35380 [Streptomyces sp. NPDC093252]|uniref:hypothetical protein n=1 Tax=Streptomyces sp. NPDC093252 TaxID=3154980 RepID=UPI003428650C
MADGSSRTAIAAAPTWCIRALKSRARDPIGALWPGHTDGLATVHATAPAGTIPQVEALLGLRLAEEVQTDR